MNYLEMAVSYLRPGTKLPQLLSGSARVMLSIEKKSRPSETASRAEEAAAEPSRLNPEIVKLTEACHLELVSIVKALALAKNTHYSNVIHIDALHGIAENLPTTAEAMLQVPHMTKALVDKVGLQKDPVVGQVGAVYCMFFSVHSVCEKQTLYNTFDACVCHVCCAVFAFWVVQGMYD